MPWWTSDDGNARTTGRKQQAPTLDATFESISRSLLAAERAHRQQLQADMVKARALLLDAVLALDAQLVDERLTADPYYLERLSLDDWAGLLREARQNASRQRRLPVPQPVRDAKAKARPVQPTDRKDTPIPQRPPSLPPSNADLAIPEHSYITPATFRLPALPERPPTVYADYFAGTSWPKRSAMLALLACTGWSSQMLVVHSLATLQGISMSSCAPVPGALVAADLLRNQTVQTVAGQVGMVELSPRGREVALGLHLQPVETEWKRLRQRYGEDDPRSAAYLVILAAYARERGYGAWVDPAAGQPDALLLGPNQEQVALFLEADVQHSRLEDWRTAATAHGALALCALDGEGRDILVRAALAAGLSGRATDLISLRTYLRQDLWAEQWSASGDTPPDPAPSSAPSEEMP